MSIYEKIRLDTYKYIQQYHHPPQLIIMTRKSYNCLYEEMWGNQKYFLIKSNSVMGLSIFVYDTIKKDYILSDLALKNTL